LTRVKIHMEIIIDAELKEILQDAIANCVTEIGLGNDPSYWEQKKLRYEYLLGKIYDDRRRRK
jgi:hypothetical protein